MPTSVTPPTSLCPATAKPLPPSSSCSLLYWASHVVPLWLKQRSIFVSWMIYYWTHLQISLIELTQHQERSKTWALILWCLRKGRGYMENAWSRLRNLLLMHEPPNGRKANTTLFLCTEHSILPCFRLSHWHRMNFRSEQLRTASPGCTQISLSDT